MSADHINIETAIRNGAARFGAAGIAFGHGTDNALDEASWLVTHALGLSPLMAPDYARVLGSAELQAIEALFARRVLERLPAAYLTGHAWFAGFEFISDARALVPRSPLGEFLQHDAFGLLPFPTDEPFRVLDLCTGGGCIAIACALLYPAATVDASDLSSEALALAARNVALHGVQDRVHLLHGSLFEPVSGRYDLIVSNPPYVNAADLAAMPDEFAHEPAMGLGAGEDGLDLIAPMLAQASRFLSDEGLLVVEVGNSAAALIARFAHLELVWLEFACGGEGVFSITRAALERARQGKPTLPGAG